MTDDDLINVIWDILYEYEIPFPSKDDGPELTR